MTSFKQFHRGDFPSIEFIVLSLIIPNAVPIIATIIGIGTPPRSVTIICYVLVAMFCRIGFVKFSIFFLLCLSAFDIAMTIGLMFSLSAIEIVAAAKYAQQLDMSSSPFYVLSGICFIASIFIYGYMLTQKRDVLKQANLFIVFLCLFAFVGLDRYLNTSPHYSLGTSYAEGSPFNSAILNSGFEEKLASTQPNVLIVMVEGLGRLVDDEQQSLVFAPLAGKAIEDRYVIERGSTSYYGSTTAGEMRELCGSRDSYLDLQTMSNKADCLPARLEKQGYETMAFHGFPPDIFERDTWYPQVGIEKLIWGNDILNKTEGVCGLVFRGACDVDIAPIVSDALHGEGSPRLVYWLTLNTHVPVRPDDVNPRFNCDANGGSFGNVDVCRITSLWSDLMEQIAKVVVDPTLPPTAIMIVGDHAPPFWSRKARNAFRVGEVSWISLMPRTAVHPKGKQ